MVLSGAGKGGLQEIFTTSQFSQRSATQIHINWLIQKMSNLNLVSNGSRVVGPFGTWHKKANFLSRKEIFIPVIQEVPQKNKNKKTEL